MNKSDENNADLFSDKTSEVIIHSGNKLENVMKEVFEQYPEESFYFLNEGTLKQTVQIFLENFLPNDDRRRIAYAVKANLHPEILRILTESGISSFDCASIGEIEKVKEVFPAGEIFFNNPHKKRMEISAALDFGVKHFTADLNAEVEKIISITDIKNINPEIAMRVKTLNPNGTFINLSEKFGMFENELRNVFSVIQQNSAKPCISMNAGSQVFDKKSYERNFFRLFNLLQSLRMRVMAVNIGGGIPVEINKSAAQNHELLRSYLDEITKFLREKIDDILIDSESSKIIIEPGRSMVASAVDLGISILNVHIPRERAITIDDGLFTSFSDSTIHSWKYFMKGIGKNGKEIFSENMNEYLLYGRTCDSGDVIHEQLLVDGLTTEDYLLVPNAGAYLSSQATQFNGYLPHRYVLYNSSK